MANDEKPRMDVPDTPAIMAAVTAFHDILTTLGVKGFAMSLAIDAGGGKLATKHLHIGVSAMEASYMAAGLHHECKLAWRNEEQEKPQNLN